MGRVSPRSFLVAFAQAARWTDERSSSIEKGGAGLLTPTALGEGVKAASVQRVQELAEDFEWIEEVASRLEGLEVPCTEERVIQRLSDCVFPHPLPSSLRSTVPSVVLLEVGDGGLLARQRRTLQRSGSLSSGDEDEASWWYQAGTLGEETQGKMFTPGYDLFGSRLLGEVVPGLAPDLPALLGPQGSGEGARLAQRLGEPAPCSVRKPAIEGISPARTSAHFRA